MERQVAANNSACPNVKCQRINLNSFNRNSILSEIPLDLQANNVRHVLRFRVHVRQVMFQEDLLLHRAVVWECTCLHLIKRRLARLRQNNRAVNAVVVNTTTDRTIFRATRTFTRVTSNNVRTARIKRLRIRVNVNDPSSLIIVLRGSRLISPSFSALRLVQVISRACRRHLCLTRTQVTRSNGPITQVFYVRRRVEYRVKDRADYLHLITLLLRTNGCTRICVRRVLLQPSRLSINEAITIVVITEFNRLRQGLVLVMVILVITTRASRSHRLIILRVNNILLRNVNVNGRLSTLMLTRVRNEILVCHLYLTVNRVLRRRARHLLIYLSGL